MQTDATTPKRPRCFVVIGFGVKTDLATGRAINLDKTYEELIRPALESAGIEGFRAIDINRTGSIDSIMYKWLFEAEVVVADLTTLNANVLYEVGVRHALKPSTTILIAESILLKSLPFDLSHTIVHPYYLDGETLREEDKPQFRAQLTKLLLEAAAEPLQDSPVYTYLKDVAAPQRSVTAERKEDLVDVPLAAILNLAALAKNKGDLQRAGWLYEMALERSPHDQFLRQQLATTLGQRAAGQANEEDARRDLAQAEEVMQASDPATSTDPQVLCAAGEVDRRLYEKTQDVRYLQKAAWHFTRAFYIRQGPGEGIEGAKLQATIAASEGQKKKSPAVQSVVALCAAVAGVCSRQAGAPGFEDRADRGAVSMALAQSYLGMGKFDDARALLPAIEEATGRSVTWGDFLSENSALKEIGRTVAPAWQSNLLWAAGGAAAAVVVTLLVSQWMSRNAANTKVGPSDVAKVQDSSRDESKSSKASDSSRLREESAGSQSGGGQAGSPVGSAPAEGPRGGQATGGGQSSHQLNADLTPRLALLMSSLGRTESRLDQVAGSLTEVRDGTSRVSGLPSKLDSLDEKLSKSMAANQNSVLTALERNSKAASGCTENTATLLQLANVLVDQTRKINNELLQVSKVAKSPARSTGPHIQFDALRPGLAEGFAYPLEDGENPIRELGVSLALNSGAAGGPAVTVRDHRTGRSVGLVRLDRASPAEPRTGSDRTPRQVRFNGLEVGEYCSLLTLSRDPRTSRWMGIIRLREGCGDSCSSGCGTY